MKYSPGKPYIPHDPDQDPEYQGNLDPKTVRDIKLAPDRIFGKKNIFKNKSKWPVFVYQTKIDEEVDHRIVTNKALNSVIQEETKKLIKIQEERKKTGKDKKISDKKETMLELESIFPLPVLGLDKENIIILGLLADNEEITIRDLPKYPHLVEVVVYKKEPEKREGMAETGNEISVRYKGNVLKKYITPQNIDSFKPYTDFRLFKNKDLIADIHQHKFGNCFLLASILAILNRPDGIAYIKGMMRKDGDTTIVRLYNPVTKQMEYIRVDNTYYTGEGASLLNNTILHDAPWVHMLEKAYTALALKVDRNKNSPEYHAGESIFLDMFGKGGFNSMALTVLTGNSDVGEYLVARSTVTLPWDAAIIDRCLAFGELSGNLIDSVSTEINELYKLEKALLFIENNHLGLYGDLKQRINSCKNSPENNDILEQLDLLYHASYAELSDPELSKKLSNKERQLHDEAIIQLALVKSMLDKLQVIYIETAQTKQQALQDLWSFFTAVSIYNSQDLQTSKIYKNSPNLIVPMTSLALFGVFLNKLKASKPAEHEKLMQEFNSKLNMNITGALPFIDKMRNLGLSNKVAAELEEIIQNIFYGHIKANKPINIKHPWHTDHFYECEKVYLKTKWIIDHLTKDQLKKFGEFIDTICKDKSTVANYRKCESKDDYMRFIDELKNIDNLKITGIFDHLFDKSLSRDEVYELNMALQRYLQLQLTENHHPTLAVKQISTLGLTGKFTQQLRSELAWDIFFQELKLNDRVTNLESAWKLLYRLKEAKTSFDEHLPSDLIEAFKKHIRDTFPAKVDFNEAPGTGLYSSAALELYYTLASHLEDPQTNYVIAAGTRYEIPKELLAPGLSARHAYAVIGCECKVPEDDKGNPIGKIPLMYIYIYNPWSHTGTKLKYDSKFKKNEFVTEKITAATSEVELSIFCNNFNECSITSFTKPNPVISNKSMVAKAVNHVADNKTQFTEAILSASAIAGGTAFFLSGTGLIIVASASIAGLLSASAVAAKNYIAKKVHDRNFKEKPQPLPQRSIFNVNLDAKYKSLSDITGIDETLLREICLADTQNYDKLKQLHSYIKNVIEDAKTKLGDDVTVEIQREIVEGFLKLNENICENIYRCSHYITEGLLEISEVIDLTPTERNILVDASSSKLGCEKLKEYRKSQELKPS